MRRTSKLCTRSPSRGSPTLWPWSARARRISSRVLSRSAGGKGERSRRPHAGVPRAQGDGHGGRARHAGRRYNAHHDDEPTVSGRGCKCARYRLRGGGKGRVLVELVLFSFSCPPRLVVEVVLGSVCVCPLFLEFPVSRIYFQTNRVFSLSLSSPRSLLTIPPTKFT